MNNRAEKLKEFQDSNHIFDLVVVGGGITGAAIARDASYRGLNVLLCEKDDFAEGTSSKSSKLIHGGVRYLEHGEFDLVRESTLERALLWKNAPEYVRPLKFLFPCYKDTRVPLWKLNLGLWLYDILALFKTPSLHKKYNAHQTHKLVPPLLNKDLKGSIFYWDGITDDALLTVANIYDAQKNGATCFNKCLVHDVSPKNDKNIVTVSLEDRMSGQNFKIKTKNISICVGPWADKVLKDFKIPYRKILAPSRGSHIMVSQDKLPLDHAIALFHPKDKRVMFAIPWLNCSVIGTTDIFTDQLPEKNIITGKEISYLLEASNHFFPEHQLNPSDVISTWAGVRPLVMEEGKSESELSRDHLIDWLDPFNAVLIVGGKFTTHREMAEQAVDRVISESQKRNRPLMNKFKVSPTKNLRLPAMHLEEGLKKTLIIKTKTNEIYAEQIDFILGLESVNTLEDFMVRRTNLYYNEACNGLSFIDKLKPFFTKILKWKESDWVENIDSYKNFIDTQITNPRKNI